MCKLEVAYSRSEKDKFRLKIVQPKIPMKAASSSYIWRRKAEKKRKKEGKLSDSPWARLRLLL